MRRLIATYPHDSTRTSAIENIKQRLLVLRIVRRPPARAQRGGVANEGSGGRRTILKGGNRGAELSRVRNDAALWGFERAGCRVRDDCNDDDDGVDGNRVPVRESAAGRRLATGAKV